MRLHLGIYTAPGGRLLLDATARGAYEIVASSNQHGFETLEATIPISLIEAYQLWSGGTPWALLRSNGYTVFEGRLTDPELWIDTGAGLRVRAFGAWDALSDLPLTTMYSDTRVSGWMVATPQMIANRVPESFTFDTNNRLYMAANKNAIQGNAPVIGAQMVYAVPSQSTRLIQNISFDFTFLDTDGAYEVYVQSFTAGSPTSSAWTFGALLYGPMTTSMPAALVYTQCVTLAVPTTGVGFVLFRNAANAVNANETDQNSITITNVRVTTAPLRVNTTITANIVSGATSFTVASAAGIVAGMQLMIAETLLPNLQGERVIVASVVGLTINVTAPIVYGYNVGAFPVCRAQWVDAAVIASDVVAQVSTLNPTQLSSSTAGIDSALSLPDLADQVYEDADIGDTLTSLAYLGDAQNRRLEVAVWEDRRLVLRLQGAAARQWYPTVTSMRARRSAAQMTNSAYGIYREPGGRAIRTAVAVRALAVAAAGFTRRRGVASDTTSAGVAQDAADVTLNDNQRPQPEAEYVISDVQSENGTIWPRWMVRAGDVATFRVIPSGFGVTVDQLRVVRITRASYSADENAVTIEPEVALSTLEVQLARQAAIARSAPTPQRTDRDTVYTYTRNSRTFDSRTNTSG